MSKKDKKKKEEKNVSVNWSEQEKFITLPKGMDYDDAIVWLQRKREEDERIVAVEEKFDAYPTDGAHALAMAMKHKYGWTNLVPTPGFFGNKPPQMKGVRVGVDETVQVPWGRIMIPGVSGHLETGWRLERGEPLFTLYGEVKRKNEKDVAELAELTRKYLRSDSIYRGKAIRMSFIPLDEATSVDDFNPQFIDTAAVRPDELIFSEDVKSKISTNLFTPILHADRCRQFGIPLKRGVLLAGPYGTGKTMTAYVAAKYCIENDWTFIYLEDVNDLSKAIKFARMYSPAVVFAEDIDAALGTSNRDEEVNAILNTIDGVDSKDAEIMVCLTTNHVDRINKAMLRPGRLDAVIGVAPPDAQAALKLLRQYGRGLLVENESYEKVGEALNGKIPAVIREVVERAKLAAIKRAEARGEEDLYVTPDDLLESVNTMDDQLGLLYTEEPDDRSDRVKAASLVASAIAGDFVPDKRDAQRKRAN